MFFLWPFVKVLMFFLVVFCGFSSFSFIDGVCVFVFGILGAFCDSFLFLSVVFDFVIP